MGEVILENTRHFRGAAVSSGLSGLHLIRPGYILANSEKILSSSKSQVLTNLLGTAPYQLHLLGLLEGWRWGRSDSRQTLEVTSPRHRKDPTGGLWIPTWNFQIESAASAEFGRHLDGLFSWVGIPL